MFQPELLHQAYLGTTRVLIGGLEPLLKSTFGADSGKARVLKPSFASATTGVHCGACRGKLQPHPPTMKSCSKRVTHNVQIPFFQEPSWSTRSIRAFGITLRFKDSSCPPQLM